MAWTQKTLREGREREMRFWENWFHLLVAGMKEVRKIQFPMTLRAGLPSFCQEAFVLASAFRHSYQLEAEAENVSAALQQLRSPQRNPIGVRGGSGLVLDADEEMEASRRMHEVIRTKHL